MSRLPDVALKKILALLREGVQDPRTIAWVLDLSVKSVRAVKANWTMGRYGDGMPAAHGSRRGSDRRAAWAGLPRRIAWQGTGNSRGDASIVCGVDGCRGGWIAVRRNMATGDLRWRVHPTLLSIVKESPGPSVVAVDMPVGLVDSGSRECDVLARKLLAPVRSSSVFSAPIRPILAANDRETASGIRNEVEGKRIGVTEWSIVPKVREVDELLRAQPALQRVVREVHPELCFAAMNDCTPMPHGKKSLVGREERIEVLRPQFGDAVERALGSRPSGCAADDMLDAFACLWTAMRIAQGTARVIPATPRQDRFGLPMEMTF